ncbi:MAG TPA: cytochrome P450 [Solirubrobacteraceae bacterium]
MIEPETFTGRPGDGNMGGKLRGVKAVRSRMGLPPGPRMPSALQAVGWAERPLSFMEQCQKRYGDTFTLRIRHAGVWVFLCDPDDIRRVFTADAGVLGVGEANSLLGPVLGPRSVMLLEEPEHMAHRRRMLPSFHGRYMERYGAATGAVAREEIAKWPSGEPFALWPRMQDITLSVIMRAVFGELDTDHLLELRELLRGLTEWMNAPLQLTLMAAVGPRSMVRNPTFRTMMDAAEAAVLEEVRKRRAERGSHERDDIASMLEQAHRADGSSLTAQELRDELITLLVDGPTSSSLAWAFERLLRHPDKLARLREEVRGGREEVYMDAVLKETLRLCPPVPIVVRKLLEPMELGGYTVPAGATVAPCAYLLHRSEVLYPEPRSFLPERFLDKPAGTYTWIPFGGGVRRCLAASFALLEMKRVIQTVLCEVELRPAQQRSERVARSSIAFVPDRHAEAIVVRRLKPSPTGERRAAVAMPQPASVSVG